MSMALVVIVRKAYREASEANYPNLAGKPKYQFGIAEYVLGRLLQQRRHPEAQRSSAGRGISRERRSTSAREIPSLRAGSSLRLKKRLRSG